MCLEFSLNDWRQLDDVTSDDVTVPRSYCGDGERSVTDRRTADYDTIKFNVR